MKQNIKNPILYSMKKIRNAMPTLALACLFMCSGCKQQPVKTEEASYKTMSVKKESRELETNYSATIRGRQDIEIYPQVSGTLQQLCVTEGQRVRKGQTLFIIDQIPYKAALATATANVKAAEATLATAKLTLASKENLLEQKVIADFDLQKAKNDMLSAEAVLAQMKALRINAENNLSYTLVKSPSDGIVGMLPYRQGALVSSTIPQPLTTVSDNSQMYVYFSMNETQLLNLTRRYGSQEEVIKSMPGVKLFLSDGSEYEEKGKVESISGIIDQNTGSVSLRAAFPNSKHLLHSGSTGNVAVPMLFENCIVIPQEATFQIQDKTLVYKVVDGKAKSINITVSPISDGKEYIVTEGLQEGDVIIAIGAGMVREGTPIGTQK